MSDYIKRQDVIDIIHKEIESTKSYIEHNTQINIKFAVEGLPTVDEKEIIHNALKRARKNLDKELLEIDKKIMRNAYSDEERLDADGFAKGIRYAYIEIRKECGINE